MADRRAREIALEQAVQIAVRGEESWAKRTAAALQIAEAFLEFLDPPPEAQAQAEAKREAA